MTQRLGEQHLSFFGIFCGPRRPLVYPSQEKPISNWQIWTTPVYSPSICLSVQSTAPLSGISLIRVFQNPLAGSINGLLLCYYDRFPAVLGSLSGESTIAALEPGEHVNGLKVGYRFCSVCSIQFFVGNRSLSFGHTVPSNLDRQLRDVSCVLLFDVHIKLNVLGRELPSLDLFALRQLPYPFSNF